jgi:hypothetical protein
MFNNLVKTIQWYFALLRIESIFKMKVNKYYKKYETKSLSIFFNF